MMRSGMLTGRGEFCILLTDVGLESLLRGYRRRG